MSRHWTEADIPDQSGRIAVVTGASGGIGLQTASILAERGSAVILACRDTARAGRAASLIRARAPRAQLQVVRLDLASQASVRAAAREIRASCPQLDLLINNAGVMAVPYCRTEDGFELTIATNHLGHFALTGLLLDRLAGVPASRIVTVSSLGHTRGVMHFNDLQFAWEYDESHAYWQSKLANLLFSYELQARLEEAGAAVAALAAHPGIVRTDLWRTSSLLERTLISPRLRVLNFWAVHSARRGALPTVRAATDPAAAGGEYYGPSGRLQYTGSPGKVTSSPRSHEVRAAFRLWTASEQLTGVAYLSGAASDRARATEWQ